MKPRTLEKRGNPLLKYFFLSTWLTPVIYYHGKRQTRKEMCDKAEKVEQRSDVDQAERGKLEAYRILYYVDDT